MFNLTLNAPFFIARAVSLSLFFSDTDFTSCCLIHPDSFSSCSIYSYPLPPFRLVLLHFTPSPLFCCVLTHSLSISISCSLIHPYSFSKCFIYSDFLTFQIDCSIVDPPLSLLCLTLSISLVLTPSLVIYDSL